MRHAYPAALFAFVILSVCLPGTCQVVQNAAPPPMELASLGTESPEDRAGLLDDLHLISAIPLSPTASIAGNHALDSHRDDDAAPTQNLRVPVKGPIRVRGSEGMLKERFGLGVSAHLLRQTRGAEGEGATLRDRKHTQPAAPTPWRSSWTANLAPTTQAMPAIAADASEPGWRLETRGTVRGGPAVVGDRVYVGGDDGAVHALRLNDGSPLWTAVVGSEVTRGLTAARGRVYVGTRAGHLVCFRPPMLPEGLIGVEQWRFDAGAPLVSSPLVTAQGRVVAGAEDGVCYAVDRAGKLAWLFETRGPIVAGPSLSSTTITLRDGKKQPATALVYCASTDGVLYALRERDGQPAWTFATGAPLHASPVVFGDMVIQGNAQGVVYAVEATTGRTLWRQTIDTPIKASPAIADGRAYFVGEDGAVVAVSLADGEIVWTSEVIGPVSTPPIVTGKRWLSVAAEVGMVYALRRGDGRVMWAKNVEDSITTGVAAGARFLVVGCEDGRVQAYVPGGTWQIDAPPAVVRASRGVGDLRVVGRARAAATHTSDQHTGAETVPADPVGTPAAPDVTTLASHDDFPSPTTAAPAGLPAQRPVEMSLLTTPNDPSQPPIQVADGSSVVISGRVAPGTQRVTVNDVPVDITGDRFRTQVEFDGTGAYPLTIKFVDASGDASVDRRVITVCPDRHPTSAAPVFISPETSGPGGRIAFTLAAHRDDDEQYISVLEIRDDSGKSIRAWADMAPSSLTFEWDGRDQWGKAAPDGEYVAVFTLRDMRGRTNSVSQPVVVDTAGM